MRCKCGSTTFHKISTATVRQEIEQYHDGRSTRFRVSEIDVEDERDVKLYCSVCGDGQEGAEADRYLAAVEVW